MKNDHRSKFFQFKQLEREAWKNQGFNGIQTRDLRNTGAMLYQLSYEATHWERVTPFPKIGRWYQKMTSNFLGECIWES